jgi:hypothetical protein
LIDPVELQLLEYVLLVPVVVAAVAHQLRLVEPLKKGTARSRCAEVEPQGWELARL